MTAASIDRGSISGGTLWLTYSAAVLTQTWKYDKDGACFLRPPGISSSRARDHTQTCGAVPRIEITTPWAPDCVVSLM